MSGRRFAVCSGLLLTFASPSVAHRLDEYLQATMISVDRHHVRAFIRLVPGVAVSSEVIAQIDSDRDGVLSEAEKSGYAQRVLRDISLTVDGRNLRPAILAANFPSIADMKDGMGEIHLELGADVPEGGSDRRLVFENRHQGRVGVYLANCLAPQDKDIAVISQKRNERQSFYQIDYRQAGGPAVLAFPNWLWGAGPLAALICAWWLRREQRAGRLPVGIEGESRKEALAVRSK